MKAFQQAREIPADGIVGKVTWINIDEADQSEPVLRIGSTGPSSPSCAEANESRGI